MATISVARSKTRKSRSRDQASGQSKPVVTVHREGSGITIVTLKGQSGGVTVLRSSRTGRFTTEKSASVIDKGAQRFAQTLKRLSDK